MIPHHNLTLNNPLYVGLTTKVPQQVTTAESTGNYSSFFNARDSLSKKIEKENSSSCYSNSNNDMMPKQDNSDVIDLEPRHNRRTCIEYTYSGITPHQSGSNGTSKINQRNPTYQLYSPYEFQNKRNRTPEYLNYQYQVTKKGISDNSQVTQKSLLIRKNSDPIRLNNVSSSSSLRARNVSRHLSIPDLQNPSGSAMANSKNSTPLSIPVNVGSSSRISVSSSTTSEFSCQSSKSN